MDNDDRPVGRILSRREALAVFATFGGAFLAACTGVGNGAETGIATEPASAPTLGPGNTPAQATGLPDTGAIPACVVRPEMTEGPFFFDEQLNRTDIRSEPSNNSVREGVPLILRYHVLQIVNDGCTPLAGAQVDVWHCDALGEYSGTGQSAGLSFLRGYQMTDADGRAQFTTIYPGWYPGRAVHIHFKIRGQAAENQHYEFTSQLFFDEAVTDQVYTQAPYAGRGERNVRNEQDGIYRSSGGEQLLLNPTAVNGGYAATFVIGMDLADLGA